MNEAHTGLINENYSIRVKPKTRAVSYEEARARYSEVGGSPYLHREKKPRVDLYLNTGGMLDNAKMQYDLYQGEIIITRGDDKNVIIEPAFFKSIESPTGDMTYPLGRAHRDYPSKFFEIVYQDSLYTFFKDTEVQMMHHTRNVPGLEVNQQKFYRKSTFYVSRGKRTVIEFNLKKDDILRTIPKESRSAFRKAMATLKIKRLKKESDYKKVFDYLNMNS